MSDQKAGKVFLKKAASNRTMVRELREAKTQSSDTGKKVILHKYIKEVSPTYKFYKVHAALIRELQKIIDGTNKRLIIQIPPRIGKSYLASRLFPAGYLTAYPDRSVGLVSYAAELAEGFSRTARSYYVDSGGALDPHKMAVNDWGTQSSGGLWAAGVGGAITGRSGSLLIVDDPVRNQADADSGLQMEKLWDWYTSTLYTRLEPQVGAIVVIQTRWSENDLIGRLLEHEKNVDEEERENWTILDLPALYEPERPELPSNCTVIPDWRTEPDEALCPQRFTTKDYYKNRALSPRQFAALYQQRPAPEAGNLFDPSWWQTYSADDELPVFSRLMLSLDCTFSDSTNSDYVCLLYTSPSPRDRQKSRMPSSA